MADTQNNSNLQAALQYPLWRGINGLIASLLTALLIWFGVSSVQNREDIAVMREQLYTIRRDLDRLVINVDRLNENNPGNNRRQ